jgi:hypothetical protein
LAPLIRPANTKPGWSLSEEPTVFAYVVNFQLIWGHNDSVTHRIAKRTRLPRLMFDHPRLMVNLLVIEAAARLVARRIRLPKFTFDRPRMMVNLLAVAAASGIAGLTLLAQGGSASGSSRVKLPLASPPEPPPLILRDVSKDDAIAINQRIPFSLDANPSAKPFGFRGDVETRARALECLAQAIYFEAASEDRGGQEAVAQVILNRVRNPAFPSSICGVVFQGSTRSTGCQFSFTCDGSLLRAPDRRNWALAWQVASAALNGAVFRPVGLATHYHANYVVPYWATSLEKNAQVGLHIFYRWPDAWGMPGAFVRRYPGKEVDPNQLRQAAVMAEGRWPGFGAPADDDPARMSVDPRTELLAVVQTLAGGSSAGASGYTDDIAAYFKTEADHKAVQLYKKLSDKNPEFTPAMAEILLDFTEPSELARTKTPSEGLMNAAGGKENLAEFMAALQDFRTTSEFHRFFNGHKPYYRIATRRAEEKAAGVRAQWRTYTGMTFDSADLTLSPVLRIASSEACSSGSPLGSLFSLASGNGAADTMLRLAEGRNALAPLGSAKDVPNLAPVQDQVIRAVFARIATLSDGPEAGRAAIQREVRLGHRLVPVFAGRLQEYEAHRDRYPTLADFLPRLLSGQGNRPVANQCGTAAVTTAEQAPEGSARGS